MSIERDDLVDITIRGARVFDFVRDNAWSERITVLSHDGTKWFLVADKSDVVIELHERLPVDGKDWLDPNRDRDGYLPVAERPCQSGCVDDWASAHCEVHGVKAFLKGLLAAEASADADRAEVQR
jgi:hypothetical protein